MVTDFDWFLFWGFNGSALILIGAIYLTTRSWRKHGPKGKLGQKPKFP
jgi:hypothetical protein